MSTTLTRETSDTKNRRWLVTMTVLTSTRELTLTWGSRMLGDENWFSALRSANGEFTRQLSRCPPGYKVMKAECARMYPSNPLWDLQGVAAMQEKSHSPRRGGGA
jgi:hypothetical protein